MKRSAILALTVCLAAMLNAVCPGPSAAQGPAAAPPPAAASPAAASPIPSATRQLLVAVADSWDSTTGTLALYERPESGKNAVAASGARAGEASGGGPKARSGPGPARASSAVQPAAWKLAVRPFAVSFGRSGLAWGRGLHSPDGQDGLNGPAKREGDGKAPAGVFALGPAFAYDPRELGAMKLPVLHATDTLLCVDDEASPLYNSMVDAGALKPADGQTAMPSHERMRRTDEQYRFGLVVRHNMEAPVRGGGSCIFLHIWRSPASPTSGCTAMDKARLKALLTRLDPARKPLLVQLTKDEYARLRGVWGLP